MSRNPNKIRCKAKSKRTGEQCKAWAKPGYKVCHYHGAGSGAPKGAQRAKTHGFFSRIFPDDAETRAIVDEINAKSPIEILWEQIVIQYTAIARAQKIMFVRDQDDKTEEVVMESSSDSGRATAYQYQQAWDKQGNFLQAQSRAMKTLEGLITRYEALLTRDFDLEEQRLRIEKLKAEVERLKNPGEADLQAYIDALKAVGEEVWTEGDAE